MKCQFEDFPPVWPYVYLRPTSLKTILTIHDISSHDSYTDHTFYPTPTRQVAILIFLHSSSISRHSCQSLTGAHQWSHAVLSLVTGRKWDQGGVRMTNPSGWWSNQTLSFYCSDGSLQEPKSEDKLKMNVSKRNESDDLSLKFKWFSLRQRR